jgi:Skp family chaperone for outer membrane proteins
MKTLLLLLSLLVLAPTAFADTQVYKWTDVDGVVHYSDKPPLQGAADLQSTDMPSFPAPDPAQIAAHQAQLDADAQAAQKLLQTQLDQEAQAKALAMQQAELDAELAAQQQAASQPVAEPIYVNSASVPRAYRANLYLPRHSGSSGSHPARSAPSRPPISLLQKPR